jgi:dihydrofolate reductase
LEESKKGIIKRKLLLQMQMSMDGYIADRDGGMDWMVWSYGSDWTWDTQLRNYHTNLMASIDCILLSRKMAVQGFNDHWAALAQRPDNPQSTFAECLTKADKVVFTKTLARSAWDNTILANGNLVDEFHLIINPVVLGGGLSPFKETNSPLNLHLIEAIPYGRDIVVLKYSKQGNNQNILA